MIKLVCMIVIFSSIFVYYTQTKPAWNQVGNDTMRFQLNAK
jgi:hypothetical protein